MDGRSHIVPLLILAFQAPGLLSSQLPVEAGQFAEELLFMDESTELPLETLEAMADMKGVALNLNSATPDQLEESGLFTPFQVHVLIKYRERYGDLYSIYELKALTGFRESSLRKIAAAVTFDQGPAQRPEKRERGMILLTVGKTLPESGGYLSNGDHPGTAVYTGSPIKMSLRIRSPLGRHLALGLSFEKDPGEQYFQGVRPEFISGYLAYQGRGPMKQLILGNFQLHHGLGLVNGSGMLPSPRGFLVNRTPISRIRPSASLSESRFERGIGCRFDFKLVSLLLWSSYQRPDLSPGVLEEAREPLDWFKYLGKTGLHRTTGEMEGRFLAFRVHSGIQAVARIGELTAGAMFSHEMAGLSRKGGDHVKSEMGASMHAVGSVHGQWQHERLRLFAEMGWQMPGSTAILAGLGYDFNDFLQGLMMLHHYGREYTGVHPSSYTSGSRITNENGIALVFHAEPGRSFQADFLLELFNYPAPRFMADVPTTGHRYSCALGNPAPGKWQWNFIIAKKCWQITPGREEPGLRPLKNSSVTRSDCRLLFDADLPISWQTRVVVSHFSKDDQTTWGHAAAQKVIIKPRPFINCTIQFVVFKVTPWENRIYLHEPGLYYSFNFPVLYGRGEKITSVITVKPVRRITLSLKLSAISYHDREKIGSGNSQVPGNTRFESEVQLRMNF